MAATAQVGEGRSRGKPARATLSKVTSARVLAFGVIAAAFGLAAYGLITGQLAGISPVELVTWVAVVAVAGLLSVSTGEGLFLCVDLPLLLAVGFLYGPFVVGIVALAGTTDADELRGRVSVVRLLFNRSQIALSVMMAAATFRLLGGELGSWPWAAVAGMCAVAADVVVNYSIVGLFSSLATRRSFPHSIRAMRLGPPSTFIPMYLAFGFFGLLLSETYLRLGLAAAIGFLAPVIVARQMFLYGHRLEGATKAVLSRNRALRNMDARIAQERRDERAEIAFALNEQVLQNLYGVTLRSRVVKEDLSGGHLLDLDKHVPDLLTSGEVAVASLRRLVKDLTQSPVGHAGLAETLSLLIRQLKDEYRIRFDVQIDNGVMANADVQLGMYLIAKEALGNAVRHANAETISVRLEEFHQYLRLLVKDDGVSFDSTDASLIDRPGIDLMKQRASEMGGTVVVISRLGKGTTIMAEVRVAGG